VLVLQFWKIPWHLQAASGAEWLYYAELKQGNTIAPPQYECRHPGPVSGVPD